MRCWLYTLFSRREHFRAELQSKVSIKVKLITKDAKIVRLHSVRFLNGMLCVDLYSKKELGKCSTHFFFFQPMSQILLRLSLTYCLLQYLLHRIGNKIFYCTFTAY